MMLLATVFVACSDDDDDDNGNGNRDEKGWGRGKVVLVPWPRAGLAGCPGNGIWSVCRDNR